VVENLAVKPHRPLNLALCYLILNSGYTKVTGVMHDQETCTRRRRRLHVGDGAIALLCPKCCGAISNFVMPIFETFCYTNYLKQ